MEELKTDIVVKPLNQKIELPVVGGLERKGILLMLIPIVLGLLSGLLFYYISIRGTTRIAGKNVEVVQTKNEEGVKDASTFRDTATGNLIENDGKITAEGTHILTRGDPSQNVYLTSSVIDLSKYVDKKVQVWGETFKGQKAGWLMDVGRIKTL